MKNRSFLIVMLFVVLLLSSCGTEQENSEGISSTETIIINESVDEPSETETVFVEQENNELLSNTYQFPEPEIYIDIPSYNSIESGFTCIYKDGESKYITFSCFRNDVANNVLEAFEVAYPKFKNNVSSWHRINTEKFTSMEAVEVNGIETQKVVGTVEYGMKTMTDCYLYGYSFIFEDVPCAIIGVVSDKSQPQEEIDELIAIVDAMMESVRTEP